MQQTAVEAQVQQGVANERANNLNARVEELSQELASIRGEKEEAANQVQEEGGRELGATYSRTYSCLLPCM